MEKTNELIQEIIEIARSAGEAILDVYFSKDSEQVEYKSDDSPLTMADRKSNQVIVDGLNKLSIQYPIVSEESKQISYKERSHFKRFWMVDPLDGTKEFVNRNGEFTVNIALIENGYPILGVVYVPIVRDMYWATKDEGAYVKIDGGAPSKLCTNTIRMTDQKLRILCSRSHVNAETQAYIERFEDPELVAAGSSLKFLWIASNRADLYPRLGPTMEWDTAAAHIILEEAGGKVLQHGEGALMEYNKPDLLNPYFVAFANVEE